MPMNVQSSGSLYYSDYLEEQKHKGAGGQELDKDAFLKILLTQLQHQDPLNPMEDKEFIAQMAQFSSLEQMTNMNMNLERFMDMQRQSDFVSHSDLIGKKVEWEKVKSGDDNGEEDEEETTIKSGTVTSVIFKDGQAQLVIDGDTKVSVDQLLSVTNPD